ncbi:hypothetical protein H2198_003767 [Neophaeococcomyces mojaviensis]|uniref:Uncharacterized protein n=1 Tax=Neophaeococcomyces mojaviensis TaxID=3383035 RepID=A0ACC3AAT7_9EURO|nr:hypothetical protein H2198_003767 [Knufia sp. JES_112]
MEQLILPEEIMSLICAELGRERDFTTLYNCARSAKSLADPALRTLYQHHQHSFVFNQTDDDFREREVSIRSLVKAQQQYFKKWLVLWRSIISSSLEPSQTYKPYCRYIRILDFRNLSDMLETNQFRTMKNVFYAQPLAQFDHPKQEGRLTVVDVVATINHVGETVVPKAVFLEEMSGHMRPGFLTRWVSQTPRLRRTVLWRGDALSKNAGRAIATHCEHFHAVSIHGWLDQDADEVFAEFLTELNRDTLQYLQLISFNTIGRMSFEVLGRHTTLKELKLNNLGREAMENLNGLKNCTQIEVLSLEDSTGAVRLEELNNDVFKEVIEWLSSCTKLRDITITKLFDGPAILAAVAISDNVKWLKLSLEGYTVRNANSASFHAALADQKYLEVLSLKGNGDDTHPQDLEIMVSSICQLANLKELVLKQVSDEFDMTHISNLAVNLPGLEEFWTSGGELSSDILPVLANLRSLKNLTLFALTQFDYDSIRDFITRLDSKTQRGFQLSLMAVDQEFGLSQQEQDDISELIKTCVDGSFGMCKANCFRYMFDSAQYIWRNSQWRPVVQWRLTEE